MNSDSRKVALVTGAGRRIGIGAAVCRALAMNGVDICFTTWQAYDQGMPWEVEKDWPGSFRQELSGLGVRSLHIECNLAIAGAADQVIDRTLTKFGSLHILVNNAAHSVSSGIDQLDGRALDDHYFVNLRSMALLCARFVKEWHGKAGGRIVNLTSGQSLSPMPDELPYAVTKGAVEAFTTSLAPAVAGRGITVNAVNPGPD